MDGRVLVQVFSTATNKKYLRARPMPTTVKALLRDQSYCLIWAVIAHIDMVVDRVSATKLHKSVLKQNAIGRQRFVSSSSKSPAITHACISLRILWSGHVDGCLS